MKNLNFLVVLLYITKISIALELIEAPCGTFDCADNYEPVCAVYQNETQQTINNICFASIMSNCLAIKFSQVTLGACIDNCDKKCSKDYLPVCTEDSEGRQETYFNECEQAVAACKAHYNARPRISKIHDGECKNDQCSIICPKLIMPICVEDSSGVSHEYDNQCLLEIASCRQEIDVIKITRSCSAECPQVCPTDIAPVCAEDYKGNHETFTNICTAKQAACQRSIKFSKIYEGECIEECSESCNLEYEYDPICVETSDGRFITFSNECELKVALCKNKFDFLRTEGECYDSCAAICPKIYQPVCVEDNYGALQTYPNICEKNVFECRQNIKYKSVRDGSC